VKVDPLEVDSYIATMSTIPVRTSGTVSSERVGAVFRLLHNEVILALKRVIGPGVVFPDAVILADSRGQCASADGRVPVSFNTSGQLVAVDPPVIFAENPPETLRYVLVHELAHFHELTTRMREGIHLGKMRSSVLWSEYFAQRVSWEADVIPPDLFSSPSSAHASPAEVPAEVPAEEAPDAGVSTVYRLDAYSAMWWRAHHDVRPDWLSEMPPSAREFLSLVVPAMDSSGHFDRLFKKFPWWDIEDRVLLDAYLPSLDRLEIDLSAV
jgi:hypothetical protein